MVVYPRWRGEHLFSQIYGLLLFGLSPLAREHEMLVSVNAANTGLSRWRGEHITPFAIARFLPVYPRWRGNTLNITYY